MQMFWVRTFAAAMMVISMAHHASATVAEWGGAIVNPIFGFAPKTSVPTPSPSSVIASTGTAQTPSVGSLATGSLSLQAAPPAAAGNSTSTSTSQLGSGSVAGASHTTYAGADSMVYFGPTMASSSLTQAETSSRIAVPEPASIALLGVGLAAIGIRVRRLTRETPKRV
jgi:hypothetical protein